MPSTARGWLFWSVAMVEHFARPRSVRYDPGPRMDHRMDDRKETAISVIRLLEQSGNSGGPSLVFDHYVQDVSWYSFTAREQRIIAVTARVFSKKLRETGFLPGQEAQGRPGGDDLPPGKG